MALLYTVFAITILCCFGSYFSPIKKSFIRKCTLCLIPICLISFIFCASELTERSQKTEQYDQLILYQEVVENSSNEGVRFDFYQKVLDWNKHYDSQVYYSNKPIFKWFFVSDLDFDEVQRIDFILRE